MAGGYRVLGKSAGQQSGFFSLKPNMGPALISGWFKHCSNAQGRIDCSNPTAEVLSEGSGNAGKLLVFCMPPVCC